MTNASDNTAKPTQPQDTNKPANPPVDAKPIVLPNNDAPKATAPTAPAATPGR